MLASASAWTVRPSDQQSARFVRVVSLFTWTSLVVATTAHTAPFVAAAVALSFVATAAFWSAVEQPSMAPARLAGRWGRSFDSAAR